MFNQRWMLVVVICCNHCIFLQSFVVPINMDESFWYEQEEHKHVKERRWANVASHQCHRCQTKKVQCLFRFHGDIKLRGGMQPMGGLGGKGGMPGAVPRDPLESLVSLIGLMFLLGSAEAARSARHSWRCAILCHVLWREPILSIFMFILCSSTAMKELNCPDMGRNASYRLHTIPWYFMIFHVQQMSLNPTQCCRKSLF